MLKAVGQENEGQIEVTQQLPSHPPSLSTLNTAQLNPAT